MSTTTNKPDAQQLVGSVQQAQALDATKQFDSKLKALQAKISKHKEELQKISKF